MATKQNETPTTCRTAPTGTGRIAQVEGWRVVLITLIFLNHFDYELIGIDAAWRLTFCDFANGFFFIISGFVLAHAYGPRIDEGRFRHKDFLRRRIKSILPLYLICAIMGLVIRLPQGMGAVLRGLPSLFMVQSWVPDVDINYGGNAPLWFVSTLLFLWAVFPWLYRWGKTWWGVALSIAIYLTAIHLIHGDRALKATEIFPLMRIPDIMIGVYCHKLAQRILPKALPNVLLLLAMGLFALTVIFYDDIPPAPRIAAIYWLITPLALLATTANNTQPTITLRAAHSVINPLLGNRFMSCLARYTMPFFLSHYVAVTIASSMYRHTSLPTWTALPLAILLSLLMAFGLGKLDRFYKNNTRHARFSS